MSASNKKFYLTTPIYYVNARPHIGHAYTTIVADVLARRHRLLGDDTFFLTGTDEHGQKIERSAAAAGIPPQQFTDKVAAEFQSLWDRMGITYDRFIRTTSPAHQLGAQKLFATLYERGHIYLDSYTGAYCVSDEAFVDAPIGTPCPDCGRLLEEVTEENFFFKLSAFQRPLLDLIESGTLKIENEARRNEVLSFVRGDVKATRQETSHLPAIVGAYEPEVGPDLVMSGEGFDSPLKWALLVGKLEKSAEGTPYVPGALKDLSISRSSFTWGIPVPEPAASAAAQKHVIYVWLDALANYMTALGYGSDDPADIAQFEKFWPADLHLVGKEIIRFHCVYWPAFLLALNPALQQNTEAQAAGFSPASTEGAGGFSPLNQPSTQGASAPGLSPDPATVPFETHKLWAEKWLPKAITAHGWLLFDNSKMSKSKGNIVRTETILDGFGDHVYGKQFPDSTKADRDLFASDVLRYFLLREIPFGQDGSFSFEALITRYNADLANGYGNLVSRTLSMIQQYFAGEYQTFKTNFYFQFLPNPGTSNQVEIGFGDLQALLRDPETQRKADDQVPADSLGQSIETHIYDAQFSQATELLMQAVTVVDGYLTQHAPWRLAKQEDAREKLAEVLMNAAEAIKYITACACDILPNATAKVWQQLGLGDIEEAAKNGQLNNLQWGGLKPGTKLGPLSPIFPRADKGLTQIMTDLENPTTNLSSRPERSEVERPAGEPATTLKAAATPTPAQPITNDPTHPAAGPRTFDEPTASTHVGGSAAITADRTPTPSHTEAPASGIFAAPQAAEATPQITIDDFIKIELRVAEIKVAERIPKADKLLRLEVDLGPDFPPRQILSGIAEWYTPEDLIGRRIVVITNLAPRKMRGLESHGMLLAASTEGGKPHLATFAGADDLPLGSRLK